MARIIQSGKFVSMKAVSAACKDVHRNRGACNVNQHGEIA
jgi:hypothetical protein